MTKGKGGAGTPKPVEVEGEAGESEAEVMARALTVPYMRHGVIAYGIADKMFG
jgi:hypothetical protein